MSDLLPNGKVRGLTHSELLELKLLRAEVDILRKENDLFREKLNITSKVNTLNLNTSTSLPHDWKLTKNEAIMFSVIYSKSRIPGSCATKDFLYSQMYANSHEATQPDIKIIDVFKCKLVKKMVAAGFQSDVISTKWGLGYFIPSKYMPLFKEYFTQTVIGD